MEALALMFGLVVGSFLNTLVHRLPIMLEARWQRQARTLLEKETGAPDATYNLFWPPSSCPHCAMRIKPWQLIPLLGYLLLRGKCGACSTAISPRYPLVEAATAALTALVIGVFGLTAAGLLACLLTWALLALALIDQDKGLLPDDLTLPMLWLGLGINLFGRFAPLADAVAGAAAGYLLLWSLYWAFKLATGKEGLGQGDFKLLALLGAWLGWQDLLPILLIASLTGLAVALAKIAGGASRNQPLPFGPHLALAGWLCLLLGDQIAAFYQELHHA